MLALLRLKSLQPLVTCWLVPVGLPVFKEIHNAGGSVHRGPETLCQTTRTKELPSSTNLQRTLTVLPRFTTGKKITRPDTSFPNKRWNMPLKHFNSRKKLTGSP